MFCNIFSRNLCPLCFVLPDSSLFVFIQKDRSVSRCGQGIIFLFQADILKANPVLYGILCDVSIFRRDRGLDV